MKFLPACAHQVDFAMLKTKTYRQFEVVDQRTQAILHEFEGAAKANRCLPGDAVSVLPDGTLQLLSRGLHELVGVLHLTSKYMYGMTSRNVPLYLCEPLQKGYPSFRVACKEKDRSQNLLVAFAFEHWDDHSELPRGSLKAIFGPVESFEAEKQALAYLSCPFHAPKPSGLPSIQADRPLLSTGTFNIDPPGCRDIDDCLTVLQQEDGSWTIAITIADVSEFVLPGTPVYAAAQKIAATTYQDGVAVRPMLHPSLSEDLCSLQPKQRRFGLSLLLRWSEDTQRLLGDPVFQETILENQESYTYESIYQSKTVPLKVVASVASFLAGRTLTDSHEWIEQYMLFYNTTAAAQLLKAGTGLFRSHDQPFEEKRALLKGIHPSLEVLAFKSATYTALTDSLHHFGLDRAAYCHASSPIRRFADIVNQRLLKALLRKETVPVSTEDIQLVSTWLNQRQKQIAAAERDFSFLTAVVKAEVSTVEGVYLWSSGKKQKVWIPSWQTTVTVFAEKERTPGEAVQLSYYCNRRKANWKERMVLTYLGLNDAIEVAVPM